MTVESPESGEESAHHGRKGRRKHQASILLQAVEVAASIGITAATGKMAERGNIGEEAKDPDGTPEGTHIHRLTGFVY